MGKLRLLAIAGLVVLESFTAIASAGQRDMNQLKVAGGLASMPSPIWVQKRSVLIDVHFAVERDVPRTDPPYESGRIRTRETPAAEPGVAFKVGDAVLSGTEGETWPIARATFETTYAPLPSGAMGQDGKFFKKPVPVLAVQMTQPFTITATWGLLEGKAGDWLVQYDDAGQDFGIVGRALFEQTYERLEVTPELEARLASMRERSRR